MKALLIDPKERTITEVDVPRGRQAAMEIPKLIDCDWFCVGAYLPEGDTVYVDDEGLLYDQKAVHLFQLDPRVIKTSSSQPLAGKGLVMGADDSTGKNRKVRIDVESLTQAVRWLGKCQVIMHETHIEVVKLDDEEVDV